MNLGDSGTQAAIATALTAIATLMLYLNGKRQLELAKRPALVFVERDVEESGATDRGVYIENLGSGTAFNLRIPEEQVLRDSAFSRFHEIPRNLPSSGKTLFCRGSTGNHIGVNTFWIIRYDDVDGRGYQTTLSNMKHTFKRSR